MSTSFAVFPTTDHIPSFRELLDVATGHLRAFIQSYDITTPVRLAVTLHRREPERRTVTFEIGDLAWWRDDCFAWFHVPGVDGGSDAFARKFDSVGRGYIEDIRVKKLNDFTELTAAALRIGRYWTFERSGGQPGIINIAYGMLAGSLALLTNGFVFSEDGAWDYERLPARPDFFLSTYFRPELNRDWINYSWTKECISWLPEELRNVQLER